MKDKEKPLLYKRPLEERVQLLEEKTRSKLAYLLSRIQKLEKKVLDISAE